MSVRPITMDDRDADLLEQIVRSVRNVRGDGGLEVRMVPGVGLTMSLRRRQARPAAAVAGAGAFERFIAFNAAGNYTWEIPADVTLMRVHVIGGGGGGGGPSPTSASTYVRKIELGAIDLYEGQGGGGGGGSGGWSDGIYRGALGGRNLLIVVGAGGAGGAVDVAGSSGTSSECELEGYTNSSVNALVGSGGGKGNNIWGNGGQGGGTIGSPALVTTDVETWAEDGLAMRRNRYKGTTGERGENGLLSDGTAPPTGPGGSGGKSLFTPLGDGGTGGGAPSDGQDGQDGGVIIFW